MAAATSETRATRRDRARALPDPSGFYKGLAVVLILGLVAAVLLAKANLWDPNFFTEQQAFNATGFSLGVVAVIFLVLLFKVSGLLSAVRRLLILAEPPGTANDPARERERQAFLAQLADLRRRTSSDMELEHRHEADQESRIAALTSRLRTLEERDRTTAPIRSYGGYPVAVPNGVPAQPARIDLSASEENDHVIMLEGIGPRYASRLNAIGIISTTQLRQADADSVATAVDTTPEQVREWQTMADLIRLKGVGPQWAEALARCGVVSISDLARRDPDRLAKQIEDLQKGKKVRIVSGEARPGTVARWIDAAKNGEYDKRHEGLTGRQEAPLQNR